MDMPDTQDDLLRRFLAGRNVPCPRCGYDLRDLTSGRCPECGDEVELHVGLVEPRMGAYIVTFGALCLGFGASSLLGVFLLVWTSASVWRSPFGVVVAIEWVLTGPLLSALVLWRRGFRRLPAWRQRGMAVAAAVATAAMWVFATLTAHN